MTPNEIAKAHGSVAICSKDLPSGGWVVLLDRGGILGAATLRPGAEKADVSPVDLAQALAIAGVALAEPGATWDGPALARLVRGAGCRITELERSNTHPGRPGISGDSLD